MRRIGFLVNPIAGMGGRVGLKGTDGVEDEARAAGAEPVAGPKAITFAAAFLRQAANDPSVDVEWLTCRGAMGSDSLEAAGVPPQRIRIVYSPPERTTSKDSTVAAQQAIGAGAELLVFCGGDGTARDASLAVEDRIPILGVPAGVKMHSGVFAVSVTAAAEILVAFARGQLRIGLAEILDLDEDAYRRGEWKIRLFGTTKTLVEPHLVQAGKMMVAEVSEESVRAELAEHFEELFASEPETLFLLGPGSTIDGIAKASGLEKTLLGIDAVLGGRRIATDLNEKGILGLLAQHPRTKLVLSPIGAQGFILGRGNLQVNPEVLRRIGTRNVIVVATSSKLAATPVLRVDTGDEVLDEEFRKKEYLFVIVGYRTTKLHPLID